MKKNLFKILIITLFIIPLISQAVGGPNNPNWPNIIKSTNVIAGVIPSVRFVIKKPQGARLTKFLSDYKCDKYINSPVTQSQYPNDSYYYQKTNCYAVIYLNYTVHQDYCKGLFSIKKSSTNIDPLDSYHNDPYYIISASSQVPNGKYTFLTRFAVNKWNGEKQPIYGGGGSMLLTLNISDSTAPALVNNCTPPPSSAPPTSNSNLSVSTDNATNITYTTAILNGHGGANITYPDGCTSFSGYSTTTGLACSNGNNPSILTLPATAYFRYSNAAISPIFCNDIYGTNMISTGDIFLGTKGLTSFFQRITNLTPDTTYYYCAIVSNRESIAYGGSKIIKQFHTSPYETRIRTKRATSVKSDSVKLNGTYSSIETVKTYFQYRKATITGIIPKWKNVGEQIHNISLKATSTSISAGGSSTLTWSSSNTKSCNASWTTSTAVSGSERVTPDRTTRYSIICLGNFHEKISANIVIFVNNTSLLSNVGIKKNLYGDIYFKLSGLTPDTKYQFRTMAKTNSGAESKTIYGSILEFRTSNSGKDKGTNLLPKVSLKATSTSISAGDSSTLTWSSSNTT